MGEVGISVYAALCGDPGITDQPSGCCPGTHRWSIACRAMRVLGCTFQVPPFLPWPPGASSTKGSGLCSSHASALTGQAKPTGGASPWWGEGCGEGDEGMGKGEVSRGWPEAGSPPHLAVLPPVLPLELGCAGLELRGPGLQRVCPVVELRQLLVPLQHLVHVDPHDVHHLRDGGTAHGQPTDSPEEIGDGAEATAQWGGRQPCVRLMGSIFSIPFGSQSLPGVTREQGSRVRKKL